MCCNKAPQLMFQSSNLNLSNAASEFYSVTYTLIELQRTQCSLPKTKKSTLPTKAYTGFRAGSMHGTFGNDGRKSHRHRPFHGHCIPVRTIHSHTSPLSFHPTLQITHTIIPFPSQIRKPHTMRTLDSLHRRAP